MYYLFITKENELQQYKTKLNKVKENIEKGKTPVFNELRSTKTCFFESLPFNLISGLFMIAGSFLISKIECNEIIKIAIVMIINSFCYQIANYIFTVIKHKLRIALCNRLNIIPDEQTIAAMESLEYQTV